MADKKSQDTPELKAAREKKLIKKLDYLKTIYDRKIPLPSDDLILLEKHGYIKKKEEEKLPSKSKDERSQIFISEKPSEMSAKADSIIDIIDINNDQYEEEEDITKVLDKKVYSEIDDERFSFRGGVTITKEDWLPKSRIYHTKEFIAWIDSINSGFQNMIPYKPFQMYCQQSSDWMKDSSSIYDYEDEDQRREWAWSELDRMKENSLYFLDKYLHVKEADFDDGFMDYKSKPVHKVMAFLMDCGYNVEMGKGRQIAATTTVGGLALCRIITRRNYFIKMIAQDQEKVQEIFEDKIKWPHSELPGWLFQTPKNDRDNLLHLGKKVSKGRTTGANSRIQVVAPTVSAINGGAPPLVLIDEGGYIGILGKMIKEARPTMFMQDQKTGKIEMKRQIWIWGTGGEMDKKGKAYEEEYKNTFEKWQNREFEYGIIPLFFDWTTRPGITKEHYDNEKRAYTVEGPDSESKMVQFRQTYPSIIEDMFLTSSKTLVSIAYINKRLEFIRNLKHEQREEYGYFEPIYDTNSPSSEHDDLPYKLVGAQFVRTEKSDPRASTRIFFHPVKNWVDRYYSGTDPIAVDNGHSNMASSIWDAYDNTVSAIVNYRDQDHKYTFLQNLCLMLYYDIDRAEGSKTGVPNLLEGNIGTAFSDYVEYKGFERMLVLNSELPSAFSGGQNGIGIDNRGQRSKFIINKLYELIMLYGDRIFIEDFWKQLSTFICKISEKGSETWETQDYRKYHDDTLYSTVFSYICSLAFHFKPPRNLSRKEDMYKVEYELVRNADGELRRMPVRKKIA